MARLERETAILRQPPGVRFRSSDIRLKQVMKELSQRLDATPATNAPGERQHYRELLRQVELELALLEQHLPGAESQELRAAWARATVRKAA